MAIADTIHDFAKGSTFEAVMSLPESVQDNYFQGWQVLSQIRRAGQLTKEGIFAEFDFKWLGNVHRQFVLSTDDTDKWPLGLAEFDVLFTSNTGRRIRTKTVQIKITAGVSN